MKEYFFAGVQAQNFPAAMAGLDELLRKDYAGTGYKLIQVLTHTEMIPPKNPILGSHPTIVCNAVAILVSDQDMKKPDDPLEDSGNKLWRVGGDA